MIDEKTRGELEKALSGLGLSPKESSVYLALLSLGLVGSSKIITETGLHGQFVYQSLETLEQKGLVQHVVQNGRKKFSAKSPSVLLSLVEQQRRTAEDVVLQLQSALTMPPKQQLEVFQGADSFIAHEFDLLEQALVGSELLVIGGLGDQFHQTIGDAIKQYDILRAKKQIRIRYAGCEKQRAEMQMISSKRKDFTFRLLPGEFGGEVNTNIWPDRISYNIFGTPVSKITLSSKTIAESQRQFFEALWNIAKE